MPFRKKLLGKNVFKRYCFLYTQSCFIFQKQIKINTMKDFWNIFVGLFQYFLQNYFYYILKLQYMFLVNGFLFFFTCLFWQMVFARKKKTDISTVFFLHKRYFVLFYDCLLFKNHFWLGWKVNKVIVFRKIRAQKR